jgi:hypothetical protein
MELIKYHDELWAAEKVASQADGPSIYTLYSWEDLKGSPDINSIDLLTVRQEQVELQYGESFETDLATASITSVDLVPSSSYKLIINVDQSKAE